MLPHGVLVFQRDWLSSNQIFCAGASECAVVDTGYCSQSELTVQLVEHALQDQPLTRIVNTHLHSDHCGGNTALQLRYPRARTYIPAHEASAVSTWDEDALSFKATGQLCPRFTHTDVLIPGAKILLGAHEWEVHEAPGHDDHAVMLFEPISRTLIAGDALWENGFGVVFSALTGDARVAETGYAAVQRCLTAIEMLQAETVIPGHGAVFTDVTAALQRARSRLTQFREHPLVHAAYAAKVLLKFKLLEQKSISMTALREWVLNSSYCCQLHAQFYSDLSFDAWFTLTIAALVRSKAASIQNEYLINA